MVNLYEVNWDAELPSETGVLRAVRLASTAGATRLAANLYEIEQGAVVSPLHFHHGNEELLFVLAGTPTLRHGAVDESTLACGEVVSFPAGPAGVHQILNRASEPARVLIVATNDLPEVSEQVENEQLAVITEDGLRLLPLTTPITADPGAEPDE